MYQQNEHCLLLPPPPFFVFKSITRVKRVPLSSKIFILFIQFYIGSFKLTQILIIIFLNHNTPPPH